jgi:hypothetical protein
VRENPCFFKLTNKPPQERTETRTHARILPEDTHAHAHARIRMHTHAKPHANRAVERARPFFARANTRVRQPHIHNTLVLKHGTKTHANTPLTEDARTIARPRIHRYPPPRAIKTRRRRSTLHSTRAPAHCARSGAPAMSQRHHTIVPGVTQSRAQPPLRPALRGEPSGVTSIFCICICIVFPAAVATQTHNDVHSQAGRRAHARARVRAHQVVNRSRWR